MNQPPVLLDVDTPEYVTLARACEITGRSKQTILRWHDEGRIERVQYERLWGYNREHVDAALRDAERRKREAVTKPRRRGPKLA